jgi:hypothetical protein
MRPTMLVMRAEESSEQTKQRRYGEGADADVLIGPFAFESNEQPEGERNRGFHGDFDCRKCLVRSVEGFQPILHPSNPFRLENPCGCGSLQIAISATATTSELDA